MAANGIRVVGLRDITLNEQLLATNPLQLFSVTLRHAHTAEELRLTADAGWSHTNVRRRQNALELQWAQPTNQTIRAVTVSTTAALDPRNSAFRWNFRVEDGTTNWGVWCVVFPQLAIADLGTDSAVLFPRGPGEVQRGVWRRAFRYHGNYPGGWCTMQFMAAYREGEKATGLYAGLHDALGSTKDLELKSDPATQNTCLAFAIPAPEMGRAGDHFALEGEALRQLLRGDWFDSALGCEPLRNPHEKASLAGDR